MNWWSITLFYYISFTLLYLNRCNIFINILMAIKYWFPVYQDWACNIANAAHCGGKLLSLSIVDLYSLLIIYNFNFSYFARLKSCTILEKMVFVQCIYSFILTRSRLQWSSQKTDDPIGNDHWDIYIYIYIM